MAKKVFLILVLVVLIMGGVFAQNHKHEAFDMLLGVGWGFDFGYKADNAQYGDASIQFNTNFGINYDFYILPWLSASTGLLFGPSLSAVIGSDTFSFSFNGGYFLTIPFSVHINVPIIEWLYLGAGIGLNIPISSIEADGDTISAKYFTNIPIDIGFDFAKKEKRAGGRLFFRVIPNIQRVKNYSTGETETNVIMTYGLFWQFYNWKIHER
jgi:hypothetical protein